MIWIALPGGQTIEAPPPVTFAPTYYPGAISPSGAMSVTVAGGEERQGIDISQDSDLQTMLKPTNVEKIEATLEQEVMDMD